MTGNSQDREERRQRVRIGVTGLAFVFLLVLLGTAISRSGQGDEAPPTAASAGRDDDANEPLAELGVAPGQSAASGNAADAEAGKPAPSTPAPTDRP